MTSSPTPSMPSCGPPWRSEPAPAKGGSMLRPLRKGSLAVGLGALVAALAPAPPEGPSPLRALAEARYKAALKVVDFYQEQVIAPPPDQQKGQDNSFTKIEPILIWSGHALDAKLDMTDD